jgi:O-antigen ligase
MNLIRKNLNYDLIQLYLICLIPFGLVFGRFFADFFLVIVCFIFIIKELKKNISLYLSDQFFKFFIVFWLIISLRSLFSEDILFSLKSSFFYIRFLIFALALKVLFNKNNKYLLYFFYSISICLLIVIFDGFVQFLLKKNILGYPAMLFEGGYRLSGFFKDEYIIGSFVSRILPFYLGIYMYCKHLKIIKNKDNYVFLLLILGSLLVVLSGERVAIFYVSLSILFGIILINFFNYKFYTKLLVISLVFSSLIAFHDGVRDRVIKKTFEQIGIVNTQAERTNNDELYIYSIHHHNHILAATKIFKENILFGSGVKMFRKVCDKRYKENIFTCTTHPHNTIMQFLSETGLVGTFFYLISLWYVLKYFSLYILSIIKNTCNNLNKSRIFYLLAILISLMPLLPAGNFFNNWISIVTYLPVGFYLLSIKKNNEY